MTTPDRLSEQQGRDTEGQQPSSLLPTERGSERWLYKKIYIGTALFGVLSLGLIISGFASDPLSGNKVLVGSFILLSSFAMACFANMQENISKK